MDTAGLLLHERDAIVSAAAQSILQASGRESAAGEETLVVRLQAVMGQLIQSVATHDVGPIARFASALAERRHAAGFGIGEVQDALDALEAATWARLVAKLDPSAHAAVLAEISTVFGAGKDALGRRYVALAAGRHAPAVDTSALFAGTER